jgi:uncharacterized coiled-coil DUF342 family protein
MATLKYYGNFKTADGKTYLILVPKAKISGKDMTADEIASDGPAIKLLVEKYIADNKQSAFIKQYVGEIPENDKGTAEASDLQKKVLTATAQASDATGKLNAEIIAHDKTKAELDAANAKIIELSKPA